MRAGRVAAAGCGCQGSLHPIPSLLPLGTQQPVRAEVVALLAANLPSVLWGDRVQSWRGSLNLSKCSDVRPGPGLMLCPGDYCTRGWAGPTLQLRDW